MATRKTSTLSPELAADMRRVVDRVKHEGVDLTSTPYEDGSSEVWVKVTSSSDIGGGKKWEYTVDVSRNPFAGGSLATGKKARNSWELIDNAGYEVATGTQKCGDITGIEPIKTGSWHKVLGRFLIGSQWVFGFTSRNDPKIKEPTT